MNKKMTLLALLASFALAGCGSAASSSHPTGLSTAESSHPTGLSASESHQDGLSSGDASVPADSSHPTGLSSGDASVPEDSSHPTGLSSGDASVPADSSHPTGLSSSESHPTGISVSESSSQEPAETYTADSVAADMNANLTAAGYGSLALTYNATYDEWSTYATVGQGDDESETTLAQAAAVLAAYLPDYMTDNVTAAIYGDPADPDYYDYFGDSSFYYVFVFMSPDGSVCAEAVGYLYNGYYFSEIYIYDYSPVA